MIRTCVRSTSTSSLLWCSALLLFRTFDCATHYIFTAECGIRTYHHLFLAVMGTELVSSSTIISTAVSGSEPYAHLLLGSDRSDHAHLSVGSEIPTLLILLGFSDRASRKLLQPYTPLIFIFRRQMEPNHRFRIWAHNLL